MQALILAAGMGRRLGKITENKTKGMIEVNGKTLLARSLDILTSFEEIERIILVIGFAGDGVKKTLGCEYNGKPIIYIENKDYAKTNNIYSLFLAESLFREQDTLLLESDLIFERTLVKKLIDDKNNKNLVLVAPWQTWMDGTVITLGENKEISQFLGKESFDYDNILDYYKTINIYKFSKEFIKNIYVPFLEAYCKAFGLNEYYENILGIITFLKRTDLKAKVLENNEKWYEIDDQNDLDIAETIFQNSSEVYAKRYGGFWRFPTLKDFCYLVNPYFPNKKMYCEIKASLENLTGNYPSGRNIIKKLASDIFFCDKSYITVGNGGSELINILCSEIDLGKVGIPLPTFEEYSTKIKKENRIYFYPRNNNFTYTTEELIAFSEKIDSLILINPDNPSGNYISKESIIELIKQFENRGKKIIIDESFADFADETGSNTFITDEILSTYKSLIVVKSLGKSYGVPGFRLGVLASSDQEIIKRIDQKLPIWNSSSFGEYFFQIFHRYRKDYKNSILKIIKEREYLYNKLSNLKFLRPIKSKANYILCEVLSPITSDLVVEKAIKKDLLLKNCINEEGLEGKNYIRIAVRDSSDNKALIEFLKSL